MFLLRRRLLSRSQKTVAASKSDAARCREIFEGALETELLTQERRSRRAGQWDWLNRPFTLWTLTTVVAGLITFFYSNYSTCRTVLNADTDELYRVAKEISYRRSQFLRPSNPIDASADGMAALLHVLDPELTFSRSEFKGRWPDELTTEGERLLRKWHFVPPDRELSFGSELSAELLRDYYFGLGLRRLFSSIYDGHELYLGASKADNEEKRNAVLERYHLYTRTTLEDSDWVGKAMIFGWDDSGFTSPVVCLRRSVWPF